MVMKLFPPIWTQFLSCVLFFDDLHGGSFFKFNFDFIQFAESILFIFMVYHLAVTLCSFNMLFTYLILLSECKFNDFWDITL